MQPSSPKGSDAYLSTFREEWLNVFFISAEVYVFGIIMYILLASGEKQYWADGIPARLDIKKRTSVSVNGGEEGEEGEEG
jgi:hypothetical protein